MRPLRIVMQAFGPFAGRELVDFTKLGERSFFLIHGPTGAGKTTLLDALCFALYGDTSGGEREARAMRSDHAAPDLATEVELEFSLGAARYRVQRSPAQSRPKKKGEGLVEAAASAELEVWKDGDWAPLVQQSNKVSERIRELIGFDGAQFRQLIVLPQGRFREVLSADSKSRQAIMERLFRTELYSRVERALKEAAGDLAHQVDEIGQQRKGILIQAGAETEEALSEARAQRAVELAEAEQAERDALAGQKDAQTALDTGRRNASLIAERERAEAALAGLQDRQGEQDLRLQAIARAKQAESLRGDEQRLKRCATARADKNEAQRAAQHRAADARERDQHAKQILAGEEAREPERQAAGRALLELEARAATWKSWHQLCQDHEFARASLADLEQAQHKRGEDCETARQQQDRLAEELLGNQKIAASEAEHQHRHERLGEQLRQFADLAAARQTLSTATKEQQGAEQALARHRGEHDEARAARERCERDWVAGQAARLAALLAAGSPCPVCGGHEHPAPAHEANVVTDAELETARDRFGRAEQALQQATEAHGKARLEYSQAEGRVAQLLAALGDAANQDSALLLAQAEQAQRDWRAAKSAAEGCAGLEKRRLDEVAKRDTLAEALRQADPGLQAKRRDFAELAANLKAAEQALPETLRADGALEAARAAAEATKSALDKALEVARRQEKEAASALAACAATETAAGAQLAEANEALELAQADFAASLTSHGFRDEVDWRAARLSPEDLKAQEEAAEVFIRTLAAGRDRVGRARQAAQDLPPPDLAALEGSALAATQAASLATGKKAGLQHSRDELVRAGSRLAELAGRCHAIEERYAVLGRMAEVANGTNPQRISFQRYVLATLLDEVLEAASIRLLRMSRKRFELQRATGKADQRSAGGLDLEVFDHQTGCSRPANTLSGGEGFLASLSLALGLADVVQSRSGGIQLETLFVDEGFGTLDPESLDFAIDTLLSLQQGGRLVGIISHVAELKERIDTRLEVRPGEKGSKISVVC